MQSADAIAPTGPLTVSPQGSPTRWSPDRDVGRLVRVPLREVWKREAFDFTTWLQENLDLLGEHLDVELENAEREQNAGAFSVDLVAEDEHGSTIVIENQLEKTDHDHLGKLITYLAAFDADRAIWISSDPRPEHVKAVAWLNDSTPASFHLFKVEAVRIGDSPPAPLLTQIVGPSAEAKQVAQSKKEKNERQIARQEYWSQLLELARSRTRLFSTVSPSQHAYISTGAGVSGLSYQYRVRQEDARALLWIDRGKDQAEVNVAILEHLRHHQDQIESAFGGPLVWNSMEDARACKIVAEVPGAPGWRTPVDQREEGMLLLIGVMDKLEKALSKEITGLKVAGIE